jgi:hypothetical protein
MHACVDRQGSSQLATWVKACMCRQTDKKLALSGQCAGACMHVHRKGKRIECAVLCTCSTDGQCPVYLSVCADRIGGVHAAASGNSGVVRGGGSREASRHCRREHSCTLAGAVRHCVTPLCFDRVGPESLSRTASSYVARDLPCEGIKWQTWVSSLMPRQSMLVWLLSCGTWATEAWWALMGR